MSISIEIDPYLTLRLKKLGFHPQDFDFSRPLFISEGFATTRVLLVPDDTGKLFPFYDSAFLPSATSPTIYAQVYLGLTTFQQIAKVYSDDKSKSTITICKGSTKYDISSAISLCDIIPETNFVQIDEILRHCAGINALSTLKLNGAKQINWIMPDQKDQYFSAELHNRIFAFAHSCNIEAFMVSIREQYSFEPYPGHYRSVVQFGNFEDLIYRFCLDVSYATESHDVAETGTLYLEVLTDGGSKTAAKKLLSLSLGLYDQAVREFYPEYTTNYRF